MLHENQYNRNLKIDGVTPMPSIGVAYDSPAGQSARARCFRFHVYVCVWFGRSYCAAVCIQFRRVLDGDRSDGYELGRNRHASRHTCWENV